MTEPPTEEELMTREELRAAINANLDAHSAKLLKWIATMIMGGILSILGGGITWGTLTYTVRAHTIAIEALIPKVERLELWRVGADARRVDPEQVVDLDKRMQRVEDKLGTVVEALQRIDSKLP